MWCSDEFDKLLTLAAMLDRSGRPRWEYHSCFAGSCWGYAIYKLHYQLARCPQTACVGQQGGQYANGILVPNARCVLYTRPGRQGDEIAVDHKPLPPYPLSLCCFCSEKPARPKSRHSFLLAHLLRPQQSMPGQYTRPGWNPGWHVFFPRNWPDIQQQHCWTW